MATKNYIMLVLLSDVYFNKVKENYDIETVIDYSRDFNLIILVGVH
jgi:hypothetical protein